MIPGLVAPGTPINNKVVWGEDIVIEIPDPGVNCTILFIVKAKSGQDTPDVAIEQVRVSNAGDIEFRIPGPLSKKVLSPGTFYFQFIKILFIEEIPSQYVPFGSGTFEMEETAASSVVPEDGEVPSVQVYPATTGYYEDGDYLYTPTGGKIPIVR